MVASFLLALVKKYAAKGALVLGGLAAAVGAIIAVYNLL